MRGVLVPVCNTGTGTVFSPPPLPCAYTMLDLNQLCGGLPEAGGSRLRTGVQGQRDRLGQSQSHLLILQGPQHPLPESQWREVGEEPRGGWRRGHCARDSPGSGLNQPPGRCVPSDEPLAVCASVFSYVKSGGQTSPHQIQNVTTEVQKSSRPPAASACRGRVSLTSVQRGEDRAGEAPRMLRGAGAPEPTPG